MGDASILHWYLVIVWPASDIRSPSCAQVLSPRTVDPLGREEVVGLEVPSNFFWRKFMSLQSESTDCSASDRTEGGGREGATTRNFSVGIKVRPNCVGVWHCHFSGFILAHPAHQHER